MNRSVILDIEEEQIMNEQKTVVEINGVKLEIDLRYAKRIDTLQIGSRVKCLVKTYSDHKIYPGIVVGFEPFAKLPTIKVCYVDDGYGTDTLHFQTFNSETKEFEIVADIDFNEIEVNRNDVLNKIKREILKHEQGIAELKTKRQFFLEKFGAYFKDIISEASES